MTTLTSFEMSIGLGASLFALFLLLRSGIADAPVHWGQLVEVCVGQGHLRPPWSSPGGSGVDGTWLCVLP